ncbi:hypothetical protein ACQY0O_000496 [Thecaphora frezii]
MAAPSNDIPDEPPPAYELIVPPQNPSGASTHPSAPSASAAAASGASNTAPPAVAPHTTGSSTNPFLNLAGGDGSPRSSLASNNPFGDVASSAAGTSISSVPELPPRRYNSATSNTNGPVSPNITGSSPRLDRVESNGSLLHAPISPVVGPSAASPAPASSAASAQQRPPSAASSGPGPRPTDPGGTSSPSVYQPPPGPPPPHHGASFASPPPQSPSSPGPSSSASRPAASQNQYQPTTVPTPGQPLLRKGKILVYPANWLGCHKCGDTGYKHGDPSHPCRKCWDKHGKAFTSALSYSEGLNDPTFKLQKPLPVVAASTGGYYPPNGFRPPPSWHPRPSYNHVPAGYPGASASGGGGWPAPPQTPHGYPNGPYGGPARPAPPQAVNRSDAETEASKMPDAPPTYNDASNVGEHERLPAQYAAPPAPPPGVGPPMHSPPFAGPAAGSPGPYAGGFPNGPPPQPGGSRPVFINHAGPYPPPGALVVMPGDPRIGGRLCFECGGRGRTESFWFGDETCFRCRGSGRILG